ncbi:acetate CoA-transferase subunit alpha [Pelosinus sp. sgz500959]|uniref:acetate CoA-transferase subunit alpha n=1 Tax=Pelosinus sp. sgz500959 TaxID=3242472 RepID=UPI0036729953
MDKVITIEQASEYLYDDMDVMIGGFLGVGTPNRLIQAMVDKKIKKMTLIANDTAFINQGIGPLIVNQQIKKAIVSHIGTNSETGKQMLANQLEVELVPQGTLAERIRCGGAGLGGILTPTGVGTIIEDEKKLFMINQKEYLLEMPLRANVSLIKAKKADRFGNLVYEKAARNFNPLMAMAADFVIAEVDVLVEDGAIDADEVMTPGILIDKLVWMGEK